MPTNKQAPESVQRLIAFFLFLTPSFGYIHIQVAVNAYMIKLRSDRGETGEAIKLYYKYYCLWTAANTFITENAGCL